jgi:hypothetical protein
MISVYNAARSETVQQLQKKKRSLKILQTTMLVILIILRLNCLVLNGLYFAKFDDKNNILYITTNVTQISLVLLDFTIYIIFVRLYYHFLQTKRKVMQEKLIRWKCKNTMHVVGVAALVFLEIWRTITKILTAQGTFFDESIEYDQDDFFMSLIDFGTASVIDFFVGITIFILIWSKNMQFAAKNRTASGHDKDRFS